MATSSTDFSVETPSLGTSTTPCGRFLKRLKSSKAIWLGPSYPILHPEWDPTNLIVFEPIPEILIWSAALEKKAAKVEQKGIFPLQDRPVATPTMFCSAIKHSTKLSGNLSFKVIAKVEFLVSPSRPTTFGFDSLAFFSPSP